MPLRQAVQRLPGDELLGDLTLELDAVRAMLGHGPSSSKTRRARSIHEPPPVRPQGRSPITLGAGGAFFVNNASPRGGNFNGFTGPESGALPPVGAVGSPLPDNEGWPPATTLPVSGFPIPGFPTSASPDHSMRAGSIARCPRTMDHRSQRDCQIWLMSGSAGFWPASWADGALAVAVNPISADAINASAAMSSAYPLPYPDSPGVPPAGD